MPVIAEAVGQGGLILLAPPHRLPTYRLRLSSLHGRTVRLPKKSNFPVAQLTLANSASAGRHLQQTHSCSFGANAFSTGDEGSLSHTNSELPKRRGSNMQRKAFMGFNLDISYPKNEEKLVWWWRTLACIPYLLALQMSTVGYFLQPVLEYHECLQDLIYYIPGAFSRLPTWFAMSYNMVAYCGFVRNKKLPLFFRFHLIMAMLMETAMGIVWHASNFMPFIYHGGGRFAEQYWAAVAVCFIVVVLGCVVSALRGMFCNLPFFSDAAMIHTMAPS